MNEELMARLALDSILGGNGNNESNEDEVFCTSIKEAIICFKPHMYPNGARYRRELVDFICEESNNVYGDADEFHNLIMDVFRTGDYFSGIKLCQYALRTYPYNCDILGDAIKAASDGGRFDLAEEFYSAASTMDRSIWNFRLFLYSVDYYQTRFKSNPKDRVAIERAIELAEDYMKYFPKDEHGYNQRAECYILENKREEAIQFLWRWIFEPVNRDDPSSSLITAQCCTTLLQILNDSHEYNDIIKVAKRGIRNSKTVQLSSSVGYFAYRWALALDAQVADNEYENERHILNALKRYQAAYDITGDMDFSNVIEQNYSLLRSFVVNTDSDPGPLIKHPMAEKAKESNED